MAQEAKTIDRVAVAALVALAFCAGILARQAFPQEVRGYMTISVYDSDGIPRVERVDIERRP